MEVPMLTKPFYELTEPLYELAKPLYELTEPLYELNKPLCILRCKHAEGAFAIDWSAYANLT
jgi:hypothetical protein